MPLTQSWATQIELNTIYHGDFKLKIWNFPGNYNFIPMKSFVSLLTPHLAHHQSNCNIFYKVAMHRVLIMEKTFIWYSIKSVQNQTRSILTRKGCWSMNERRNCDWMCMIQVAFAQKWYKITLFIVLFLVDSDLFSVLFYTSLINLILIWFVSDSVILYNFCDFFERKTGIK